MTYNNVWSRFKLLLLFKDTFMDKASRGLNPKRSERAASYRLVTQHHNEAPSTRLMGDVSPLKRGS